VLRHYDELGLLRPDHVDGASGRDHRLRGSRSALCTCDSCTKTSLRGDFTGVDDQLIGPGDMPARHSTHHAHGRPWRLATPPDASLGRAC